MFLDPLQQDFAPYDRPQDVPILNRDSPQAQGLIGWVPYFGESVDAAQDRSPYRNNIAKQTAGTITPALQRDGHAIRFESNGGWYIVEIPSVTTTAGKAFTMSAWAFPTSNSFSPGVLSVGEPSALGQLIIKNQSGTWDLGYGGGTAVAGSSVVLNQPILITGIQDPSGNGFWYENGVLINSGAIPDRGAVANCAIAMDQTGDGSRVFIGSLWDIRFYDRLLSPAEVWALYHPDTRWDLSWQPRIMVPGWTAPAAATSNKGLSRRGNRRWQTVFIDDRNQDGSQVWRRAKLILR